MNNKHRKFGSNKMADNESQHSGDYDGDEENEEENDQFLLEYFSRTPDNDLFRPALADEQKIGFFSLDRSCQTEETEIIDLKEMTKVITQLTEDAASMKRDINFARHVMEADFEAKLQHKSVELYCRVNDQIGEIEKVHAERVGTVRRAFKQQLSDAISRMHAYYQEEMKRRLSKDKDGVSGEAEKWEAKCKELQATIQRNEAVIQMLKQQLSAAQKEQDELAHQKPPSRTESVIAEIDSLRDEICDYQEKMQKQGKAMQKKERELDETKTELNHRLEELEKERIMIQQLKSEKEDLQSASEEGKAAEKRQLETMRLQLKQEMDDKIRMAKEEALSNARKEAEVMQGAEQDKINQLIQEKKDLQKILEKERAKANMKTAEQVALERAQYQEARLQAECARLRKEMDKGHKTWEKKFAILQQSLHALKDESFLRQTLQRQAAQLHQASISYAYDHPVGITPTRQQQPQQGVPVKKPLPHIGKSGKSPAPDYISYTVSAGSGRGTTVPPMDENQVMSGDEQDLPPEFVPIPAPPVRSMTDCAAEVKSTGSVAGSNADSRPSTRSHIVVLPSVEAQ